MRKFSRRIEVASILWIMIIALLVVGVGVQIYLLARPDTGQQVNAAPTIGKPVSLSGEDWSTRPKTILLALQTTCHFCDESAPFYRRLVEYTKGKNIKIIAAFPQTVEESTAHLSQLGVTGVEVKQAPISDFDASGTPTLILTNERGEVTNYWVGKLTPEKEAEVFNKLNP